MGEKNPPAGGGGNVPPQGGNIPPQGEAPQAPQGQPLAGPSDHPLARQFRRERFSQGGPNRAQGNWRDRKPSNPRFRKSHY